MELLIKLVKVLDIEEINEKISYLKRRRNCTTQRKAKAVVKKKSLLSSGMSVVPIPGLDFGVDIKLMKDIIEDINKIYGLDQNKSILLVKMLKNVFYQRQQFKVVQ